ncbi:MFS transporter [Novosphingobium bradum]|uniref:MFS transporter n=1 Tax=Novosphingobium bradum TaxID=1737444 RepID=A0ABV7IJ89_9SPHN
MKLRALEPLGDPVFRRIWSASLMSNLAQLVLGVAAAWEMTRLTNSPQMVALVQSAMMLPLMFVAVPAGAFADMFDRRKIAISGLCFSSAAAAVLTALLLTGHESPWILLLFCFLIGAGVATYGPSWQASIPEQVPPEHLPAAVALGSVSYNIARSFGPALGGLLVVGFGATVVFGITAVLYLPLAFAFLAWRRRHVPPRLSPERLDRAIISGVRYALHAGPVRAVMFRCASFGVATAGLAALTPLVAKDLLHGTATTYGVLLGAGGVGAVMGAVFVSRVVEKMTSDRALAAAMTVTGLMIIAVGFSRHIVLTCLALCASGAANMIAISLLNVTMQVSVPRWVTARALAWFTSTLTGGIAFGSWVWGNTAASLGVSEAMALSGAAVLVIPLLGKLAPLPTDSTSNLEPARIANEPNVALALTGRSGPITIEIDYRVDPANARSFYDAMLDLQRARKRNGAFGWVLSRDIGDPELWTEKFEFPTWQDYLRHRERFTEADRELQDLTQSFSTLSGDSPARIRRKLERPFGSVRWKADTPDPEATNPAEPVRPRPTTG